MKKITDQVGREKAIELVTVAYNTELLTTWLSRLETNHAKLGGPKRHDHLSDALERVAEVCELTV